MKEGISILIAAYRAEKYIEECINSITTTTPHEILIGVDGCRKTYNLIKKKQSDRIKIYNKEINTGAYDTWNMLVTKASFNHILIFAADDIMNEGFLDNAFDELGGFDYMNIRCHTFEHGNDSVYEWVADGVILIRTDVIKEVNGYQRWQCSGDTELKYRLKHYGYFGKASNSIGFRYRRHEDSLTMRMGKESDIRLQYKSMIDEMLLRKSFTDPIDGISSHASKGSD